MSFLFRLLPLPLVLTLCLLTATTPSRAQLMGQNGIAAGTCYSGGVPGGFVLGLLDIRQASLQPFNVNWIPPMYHGPGNSWTAANLGEVFGVEFDPAGNIYVTAAMVYSQWAPPNGPGGSGAVYRINSPAGTITNLVTTLNASCGSVNGTSTLPNDSLGLGNVVYDPNPSFTQIFVSNFEDGKIYRINSVTGIVQSSFDPFTPDGCLSGPAPLGERIWGVGIYNGRLYFSRWSEDQGSPSSTAANEIWSVALTGGNFSGAPQLEITLPILQSNYSNPVSDISFSAAGEMLLAERSMSAFANNPLFPSAHQSRLLEYEFNGSAWVPTGDVFSVGISPGNNSAGGCDYGYGGYDPIKREPVDCDSTVWVSADALHLPNIHPDYIYGFAQLPASGGSLANSVLIDADADITSGDKLQIGDIEVFKKCTITPSDPCAQIRISAKPVVDPTGQGPCCFDLTISGVPANTYSSVSAQLLTPSVAFTGVIGPTGWGVTNTGTFATWDSAGTIPGGTSTGLKFCLYSLVPPVQQVVVTLHGIDGTVCRDTLDFDCPQMPPPFPPCVLIKDQKVECKETGPNGSSFSLNFTVTNQSPFSLPPYNLPAENVVVYAATPGVNILPGGAALSPVLGYGATSGPLGFTISGPGAQPGDTICFVVQLHGRKLEHDYQWCCPPDTICLVLPQCKDCCDSVDIVVRERFVRQNGNSAANISSTVTVTPGPVVSASATVIGVSRSGVWCRKKNSTVYTLQTPAAPTFGLVTNAAITPAMPLSFGITPASSTVGWGTVPSGVPINPGQVGLQMSFPGANLGWLCRDTLTICVRYSFTDTACRTCDTVVYYKLPRQGEIEIKPHDDIFDLSTATVLDANGRPRVVREEVAERATTGDDAIIGPELQLEMKDAASGVLSVAHWWPEDLEGDPTIRLTRMYVRSSLGRDITQLVDQESGDQGRIADLTAGILIGLNKGDTDLFDVRFANPNGAPSFPVTVWFDYVMEGAKDDTLRSRDYTVIADVDPEGRLDVELVDKSTPILYKLRVISNDYDTLIGGDRRWMAPESITFRVGDGQAILASGPMPDSSAAMFEFFRQYDKATPQLMLHPVKGRSAEKETFPPNDTADLWLVISGDAGEFDVEWEAVNGEGQVIAIGTITLDTITTGIRGDETPGGTIHLLQTWPNPTNDEMTASFRLTRSDVVSLTLFDAAGREVSRVIDADRREAGRVDERIDLSTLPEGVYLIRLTTSEGMQARTITVVR